MLDELCEIIERGIFSACGNYSTPHYYSWKVGRILTVVVLVLVAPVRSTEGAQLDIAAK